MKTPSGSPLAEHFVLDPNVVFLNHGSFGACPRVVLEKQQELRERMERQPVQFFARDLESLMDASRSSLAAFLKADVDCMAFVPNITTAANAVLRSLEFEAGDEILTTNHEYNACKNIMDFVAARTGARVVVATVPFPIQSSQDVVHAVIGHVTSRTKLLLVDHVTSQTGLVFPVEKLVAEMNTRGIDTFVDGAHAPGMVDLDLESLGAAYYGGNCHKWLCSPKGAAFLYVRKDRQHLVHPSVISHGYNANTEQRSRYYYEFFWQGTSDPTAFLCVPDSIEFMANLLPGGWNEIRQHNRALVLFGQTQVCEALGLTPPCPAEMVGAVAPVKLPDGDPDEATTFLYSSKLQIQLMDPWKIEVPIIPWPNNPARVMRISAQVYNSREHYQHLAKALSELV